VSCACKWLPGLRFKTSRSFKHESHFGNDSTFPQWRHTCLWQCTEVYHFSSRLDSWWRNWRVFTRLFLFESIVSIYFQLYRTFTFARHCWDWLTSSWWDRLREVRLCEPFLLQGCRKSDCCHCSLAKLADLCQVCYRRSVGTRIGSDLQEGSSLGCRNLYVVLSRRQSVRWSRGRLGTEAWDVRSCFERVGYWLLALGLLL